ncbi:hypothetical protein HBB16_16570 [Pseudonocardia sp. MCCB 268]|nr:hypothetical protein [Pseudonocardia cytotoxica]
MFVLVPGRPAGDRAADPVLTDLGTAKAPARWAGPSVARVVLTSRSNGWCGAVFCAGLGLPAAPVACSARGLGGLGGLLGELVDVTYC